MALADRIIAFMSDLMLSGGDCDGKRFEVLRWERRFVRGAFSVAGDAALSVARGNGKSCLVAGLACAVVDPEGPLHGRRREVVACASSFQQGRVIFEDCREFLRERHGRDLDKRALWRMRDSTNEATLEHRGSGARVRCIGSDPARAHGLRPMLALCDEPPQWPRGQRDKMLAALRTGLGKVPGSRLIALGTRPADAMHWFSVMLAGGADYAQVHAAREGDPEFQVRTWRRANPSWDKLPSLRARIRKEAEEARADPSLLPSFRALRLNMGTADHETNMLMSSETWRRVEADVQPAPLGPMVLGVDAGGSAAMSAACGYWPETGRLEALAMFAAIPDLSERGKRDGVGGLYHRLEGRGELVVVPGRVVPLSALLTEARERWGTPAAVVADRFREAELRQGLDDCRFPPADLVLRGQGYRDGGQDVRAFRKAVLAGNVTPGRSLLLRAAMAEAVTTADTSANEKLAKGSEGGRRARARDDTAAAAILAVAEGSRRPRSRRWRYRGAA